MAPFVPRERKHRRLEKQKTQLSQGRDVNTNAESIQPATQSEKDERRRKLKDELTVPDSKLTSKKKKRLDKYIDTKLRKEENLELLKKLAVGKVDTSLLHSSKKLGRQKQTKREEVERALRERDKGLDVDGRQDEVLFQRRPDMEEVGHGAEDEDEVDDEDSEDEVEEQVIAAATTKPAASSTISFGSGLKRPLETDETGQPVIKKRKRRKQARPARSRVEQDVDSGEDASDTSEGDNSAASEDEWNGFDSGNEDLLSESPIASDSGEESDEEESESSPEPESDDEPSEDKPARVSAFKAWADSQRNESLGFTPSTAPTNDPAISAAFKPRAPSPDAEVAEIANAVQHPNKDAYRPATAVVVPRSEDVQAARLELPVVQDEQKIMEAIHNNPIVVVCGATGSGKTTQLPQMLLENGYATTGMIGITQPRRVAAVSVASRVAHELGPEFGKKVAHQVRYDSTAARDTSIKFMTDGILLREIGNDFVLSKYSAIVIDEAHERSVNTDILIGMLSRIVPLRQELSRKAPDKHKPLKLIIMSATLRVADFLANDRLFRSIRPPIVQAEGRQYAVTEHFARRTQRDYVTETVAKVSRGHKKLPPGGILVFLTGQEEIQTVAKRLKDAVGGQAAGLDFSKKRENGAENRGSNDYLERELDDQSDDDDEPEITGFDDDEDDTEFVVEDDPAAPKPKGPLKAHVLPLYASLPTSQQMRVFEAVPEDSRIIVLATNVAETSLTIPGIKYVFDCGRSKEKDYNISTGVQEFKIDWISKASASQRMGRAGRTGPGHCYRLYSSAIYEQYFDEHTLPEILRTPIEGTVLQLKSMEVDNVVNFPFPTPPQIEQLSSAERLLRNLGAIDNRVGKITDIGKELIHYPVNPRFGKMLLLGLRNGALAHTIALVAGLAVGDLFIPEPQIAQKSNGEDAESDDDEYREKRLANNAAFTAAQQRRQAYGRAAAKLSGWDDKSDAIKLLTAVAAHAQAEDSTSFCAEFFLREKGMVEVQQLRRQLHNIMQAHVKDANDAIYKLDLPPPTTKQIAILKQIVAAGYIDQIAVRADLLPTSTATTGRPLRRAIEVPYRTLLPTTDTTDHQSTIEDQSLAKNVYPHSSSLLSRLSVPEMPAYVVYSTLSRASTNTVGAAQKRTRMHPLSVVGPKQIAALAEGTPLLELGKPIGKIVERDAGKKRECWVGVRLRDPNDVGWLGWPLGAWKVVQARKGREWVVEKVLDRGGGGGK